MVNCSSILNSLNIFLDNNISYCLNTPSSRLPIVHLDVTERCNAKCRICNLWRKEQGLVEKELKFDEIERLTKDLKRLDCLVVSLGGGEPLIRQDLFDIIRMITSYGMTVHTSTNGILLNKDTISSFKKAGLKTISVSLDSHIPEVHNDIRGLRCFNPAVDGMRLIKEIAPEIKVIINCVLNRRNINNLINIYKLALDLKVDGIKFPPIHKIAKQDDVEVKRIKDLFFDREDAPKIGERIEELIEFDKSYSLLATSYYYFRRVHYLYSRRRIRHRCFSGITTCLITSYGEVSPCYNFHNFGKVAGNVREKGFLDIWNSPEFKRIRQEVKECKYPCWDLCTEEPSLRLNIAFVLKNFKLILREMDIFS
ncbi:MAG: radical SAM protein [Candidatus Omnitrophica bacterium]|nr:radical SAM protein [Candidatus Omnitrophota bacterium]